MDSRAAAVQLRRWPIVADAGVTAYAGDERHWLEVGRGRMISSRPRNKQTAKATGG